MNNDFSISELKEYDNHHSLNFVSNTKTGLKSFIAIHRATKDSPAFGATRLWRYNSEKEALVDALKLAKIMSYKSALANLKYGGGKAIILSPQTITDRSDFLKSYCEHVNILNGYFITGSDVGISPDDVKTMRTYSKHIVGVDVDPVKYTAMGIYYSILASVQAVFGDHDLANRTVAVQGVGKIGMAFIDQIYKDAKKIYVADVNQEALSHAKSTYPNIEIVDTAEIYKQKVDVFSPCALSNTLNSQTINELTCSIVCGGANGQLIDESIGSELFNKGILYAPDYVVNAGGLISVVDEYENGKSDDSRIMTKIKNIGVTLSKIIDSSKKDHLPTNQVADVMAKKIISRFEV